VERLRSAERISTPEVCPAVCVRLEQMEAVPSSPCP